MKNEEYWKQRSLKYNNLEWVNCNSYVDNFCRALDLKDKYIILDMGAGTGAVANDVKKYVEKVVALDISPNMLKKGKWEDVSFIRWDMREPLFANNIFDRVAARMVFHHILTGQERAIENCYNCLKESGKFVIAEDQPPSNSNIVLEWHYNMFSYKEERVRIVPSDFRLKLQNGGFCNIEKQEYFMFDFNINNWIENSGLGRNKIDEIIQIHLDAPDEVKEAYNMRIKGGKIIIDSKYMIMTGQKING